ncbi:MAG TPA: hypothetical protein VK699_16385 [Terriglobales bacterium]|nr:hypothetical protein [Terriglobales bacterium]
MAKKSAKKSGPSAKDAQIVMQLYDLRREARMREAREYLAVQFFPESAEDFIKIATAFGSKENAHFRQVFSYWNMAASLAVQEVVDKQLFKAWSSEMFFLWAKIQPYINEVRAAMGTPEFLHNVESLVEGDAEGRKRRQNLQQRQKKIREMRAAAGSG